MSNSILRTAAGALACGLILVVLSPGPHRASPEPDGRSRVAPAERPGDPPSARRAADDPLARSRGARVAAGPYLSIQVNVDPLGQNILGDAANEPSIAVNPISPDNIVVGWRQFDDVSSDFRQAGWAYSLDGGRSWTFPGVLTPGLFRSDPVLGADSAGAIYYQSLTSSFAVDVFKSLDGGVSWLPQVPAFGGDKNWMAIDRSGGPGDGHVYGIWQRFAGCCGINVLTRSTDGGSSFESPVPVALWPTFGTMEIGPDGSLYAAGIDGTVTQDFDHFVVSRSANAQDALSTPAFSGTRVEMGGRMTFGDGPNPAGLLGQADVAVDSSNRFTRGNVYLVTTVDPDGPIGATDVTFSGSIDGGASWSEPLRVHDDPTGSGSWQWFGAVSVAPNGRIDVVWNDSRNFGSDNVAELFYAYSYDGGRSWSPNVPVSRRFDSHLGWPNQEKIGDYYDIVSDASGAAVAYAATFNLEQDVYFLRVFPDCDASGLSDVTEIESGLSQDCNGSWIPDVCEPSVSCTAAGEVSDGVSIAAPPLRVGKAAEGDILLDWSASCLGADGDYEIYEGAIGDFASHEPLTCTTGGETERIVSPSLAAAFYLVVPTNSFREGSLGRDSGGNERPQGLVACLPQEIGRCPGF